MGIGNEPVAPFGPYGCFPEGSLNHDNAGLFANNVHPRRIRSIQNLGQGSSFFGVFEVSGYFRDVRIFVVALEKKVHL